MHSPASSHITSSPQFAADDLLTLQTADPTLRTMANHISDPLIHPISTSELRIFFSVKHMVHLKDGVLTYVPKPLTAPKLVVPQGQRGMILTHTHDAPCTGHHDAKATYEEKYDVTATPAVSTWWPESRHRLYHLPVPRRVVSAPENNFHLHATTTPKRKVIPKGRGGKSTKIFYSSKSTITLLKFYLSTSKSTSLKIYSSKSKK